MSFDTVFDRRASHCVKWDMMETLYGVPAEGGLAMWARHGVSPAPVSRAVERMAPMASTAIWR